MAPSTKGTSFQRRFQRLFSSWAPCSFGSESKLKTADISLKFSSFINDLTDVPYLAEEKRNVCEGILRYDECFNVLQTFQKNKSPVNDGLTAEFCLAFWPLLAKLIVDSLNYAFEYGELSKSQKQAVITLIEKKEKDKKLVKNWRPISLVNVDAKLGSKTLAKRLEKVLPEVIHFNQNAFVKGRTIFDAVRTIDDAIEYASYKDIPGILGAPPRVKDV